MDEPWLGGDLVFGVKGKWQDLDSAIATRLPKPNDMKGFVGHVGGRGATHPTYLGLSISPGLAEDCKWAR